MRNLIIIIFSFIYISTICSQDISLNAVNKELSGNTWTFDLEGTIGSGYVGTNAGWNAMNVRMDIVVPSGTTIISSSTTGVHASVSNTSSTQISVPGSPPAGSIELGLTYERNTSSDFSASSTVIIASVSVTFSSVVPGANLVTIRANGVPISTGGSSYNLVTDANRRPFVLPAPFPLPITIKTFSATKDGERWSKLNWTSSSEINSDYIGIERSTDGEDWTTIGQVKAAGNSNRDIDYIYYDRSLPMARSIDNIFYYRLKLTDLDGQYKYSETRGVNMGRLEGLVSIYPNPATDIINVDLTDMDLHEGIIHLSVYDNTGKAIISKEVNGAGIEPIQASNMAAGSYQVVVKQGDTTHRKQIIVVN